MILHLTDEAYDLLLRAVDDAIDYRRGEAVDADDPDLDPHDADLLRQYDTLRREL